MNKFDPQKNHRHSNRLKGYDYSQEGAYYVTIVTRQRELLFGEIVNKEMYLSAYGEIVQKWWGEIPVHFSNVETGAFVIMPNHIHGIIYILEERRGTVSVPKVDGENSIPENNETAGVIQGGGTPPLQNPTLGQIVAYFKYQSTKAMNKAENTGKATKFWQRNYYEPSSATKKTCKIKPITSNPIRCCGMRTTRTLST